LQDADYRAQLQQAETLLDPELAQQLRWSLGQRPEMRESFAKRVTEAATHPARQSACWPWAIC
jgi:hypothetical protein